MKNKSLKLLLINWEFASWKYFKPILEEGFLPNLKQLANSGVSGNLQLMDSITDIVLTNAIASGKGVYKHQVASFAEYSTSDTLTYNGDKSVVAPFWERLSEQGVKIDVLGWPFVYPAPKVEGTFVSSFYQLAELVKDEMTLKIPIDQLVFPVKQQSHLTTPIDTNTKLYQKIFKLLPKVKVIKGGEQKAVDSFYQTCQTLLTNYTIHHQQAIHAIEQGESEVISVTYGHFRALIKGMLEAFDLIEEQVKQEKSKIQTALTQLIFKTNDLLLGDLLERAGKEVAVMLYSNHGYRKGLEEDMVTQITTDTVFTHKDLTSYGVWAFRGTGVCQSKRIFGVTQLDIIPTCLHYLGLSIWNDIDGKVITNAFEEEEIEVNFSKETEPKRETTVGIISEMISQELLSLLEKEGLLEAFSEDKATNESRLKEECLLAEALFYMDAKGLEQATKLFEDLIALNPKPFYTAKLATVYMIVNRFEEVATMVETLLKEENYPSPNVHILQASLHLQHNKLRSAMRMYEKAETLLPKGVQGYYEQTARGYLALQKHQLALKTIQKELQQNKENPGAYYTLGQIYMSVRKYKEAAQAFLNAIDLVYIYPIAHHSLAECLVRLKKYKQAIMAAEVALKLNPFMEGSRRMLIKLYNESRFRNPERAKLLEEEGKQLKEQADKERELMEAEMKKQQQAAEVLS